jgi:hypothetical protein
MAVPMANDPPFATLNHFAADLGIPSESDLLRIGISQRPHVSCELPQPPPRGDRLSGVPAMLVVAVARPLRSESLDDADKAEWLLRNGAI